MSTLPLLVEKCPTDELAYMNKAITHPDQFKTWPTPPKHVIVRAHGDEFLFTIATSELIKLGTIAFSGAQRNWAKLAVRDQVEVKRADVPGDHMIGKMALELEFQKKKFTTEERFDTTEMSRSLVAAFTNQIFSLDQEFSFQFQGTKDPVAFRCVVKGIEAQVAAAAVAGKAAAAPPLPYGLLTQLSVVTFSSSEQANVLLSGDARAATAQQSLFDPDWKYEDLGVGGLDAQFRTMFRRAFASRIFPPEVIAQLGIPHVKGILLYGPPGTGKTLMARQIGKMLHGREPKVVNGPEILNKYVGESEANIRKLFADAEAEYKARGENSSLHIIIFDEIDAICKARGSTSGGTGVQDSIVNQLLSKIDGVDALNNILLIGMTNRKDMIDEALLRPGRLELQLQIGLPDETGRVQILKIHTKKMRDAGKLATDVQLEELAHRTKNFSGADIAGLVRDAVSFATERCIRHGQGVVVDQQAVRDLKVTRSDFDRALEESKPAFGVDEEEFASTSHNGIVEWSPLITSLLQTGDLLTKQCASSTRTPLVSLLLDGPSGVGTTAMAARIAQNSGFPFIKLISPERLVGFTELAKVAKITQVFEDAYKSNLSVVVVDDLERLIDWVPIGARFSNTILQALLVLFKKPPPKDHRLLVIATTSSFDIMARMGVVEIFSKTVHIPRLNDAEQVFAVLEKLKAFDEAEVAAIRRAVKGSVVTVAGAGDIQLSVAIKKLYMLVELSRQSEDPAQTFISSLFDECKENLALPLGAWSADA